MTGKSSIFIALACLVLTFVGLLWLANVLWPYDVSGEGAKPENYPW